MGAADAALFIGAAQQWLAADGSFGSWFLQLRGNRRAWAAGQEPCLRPATQDFALGGQKENRMNPEILTYLLRGGHIGMEERMQQGLWPHSPIKSDDILNVLVKLITTEGWFPGTIESMGLDKPGLDGQMTVERKGKYKYICHFADHYKHRQRSFLTARGVAKFYMKWALNLPGNLDGWKVIE